MAGGAIDDEILAFQRFAALLRQLDLSGAVEVVASDGMALHGFFGGAGKDHFATMSSGAGTDIDEIIGVEHGVPVVFHHDDGVADVAELL